MSIDIDITHDLERAMNFLSIFSGKHTVMAHRRSLNRTVTTMVKESVRLIKQRYKLKTKSIKKRHLRKIKAIGGRISKLEAGVAYSSSTIPLIAFVRGSKDPAPQKGIKISKRRKVKLEIVPGQRFKSKSAFIARVKTKQVFLRRAAGQSKLKKQGVRSIANYIRKRNVHESIIREGRKRYVKELEANLGNEFLKASKAARGRRVKV